jgi:hypothetical protein
MAAEKPFTVASAQLTPVFMDRKATIEELDEVIWW